VADSDPSTVSKTDDVYIDPKYPQEVHGGGVYDGAIFAAIFFGFFTLLWLIPKLVTAVRGRRSLP
jgi:hypothetical protein